MSLTVDEFSEWNQKLLARQPVTRRSLLLVAMAAGLGGCADQQHRLAERAFTAGGGTPGKTGVVISGRHLSFVPGARDVPRHAMAVTAQLASKTGSLPAKLRAFVDVGDAPGTYGTQVEAGIKHLVGLYAIPGGPAGSQFYAKAKLTGLKPDTVYHYRVRLSDGTVSGDAHFTTAPEAAKAFTFTAFADVGTHTAPTDPKAAWHADPATVTKAGGKWPKGIFDNNEYSASDPIGGKGGTDRKPAASMTKLMSTQRPAFTLLAGDICYANPSGTGLPADDTTALTTGRAPAGKNLYNPYVWDVFLNQIEPQAAYTPWMFATGNHDMEPIYGDTEYLGGSPAHGYGGHVQRLDMPGNGPKGCPSVYKFAYGNVGVISLDANELSWELQSNTGYSGGAQLTWLTDTLRGWRAGGSGVDFIVVFFHHCAFSTAHNHASDGGVRAAVEPLFTKYQVDLAVQGHNHLFERTDPIRHGKRTKAAPDGATVHPAEDGVTYICVGSGGRPRYPFRPAPGAEAPAPAGVVPKGEQKLREGQRYRGYRPDGKENTGSTVVNSYFWEKEKDKPKKGKGAPTGQRVAEAVEWSQVRYDGYAFIAVDVAPALAAGGNTTMTVRTLADALPGSTEPYTEIDRITLKRQAGLIVAR
ncbi:metallophosphoesterase [Actinoplanes awajinensis]|uniref:Phosphoesterase n=1 Tax=Actinoplanes awajinensis subsp. mycoplanecinus TaxID=135947 RepID=A0A101JRQ7_9ACTN|nr:metallophosphoesterase family protein [Actinoplanes awajinensis]KUL31236.1 phosphoesterase [Actinoplanes awajinensis subsp. mycoplanecinus]